MNDDDCAQEFCVGERKLWCEVIRQAIDDYIRDPMTSIRADGQKRIRSLADSAGYWLFRASDSGIGSLRWICLSLGLDLGAIRSEARSLRKIGILRDPQGEGVPRPPP